MEREPTLHELNLQQRKMEEERRELRQKTGQAALDAVRSIFGQPGNRRGRKQLRPPEFTQAEGQT